MFKVLIADKNMEFRDCLGAFLIECGYAVVFSPNLGSVISDFKDHAPDLVLLGIESGDSDVLEISLTLRGVNKSVPIIMLSADRSTDSLIQDMFSSGASDYISKPINWVALGRRLEHELTTISSIRDLEVSKERFRALFHHSPLPYVSLNADGIITDANISLEDMFSADASRLIGANFLEFLFPEDREEFLTRVCGFKSPCRVSNLWASATSCDGLELDIEINGDVIYSGDEFIQTNLILQDITERKQIEEELRIMSTIDPLTGINNRRAFFEKADQELMRSKRYGSDLSVVMLDIDLFKNINDTFGHSVGDSVLKLSSDIISQELRESDILGRLGGEEFAIVMPETNIEAAIKVANRVRLAIERFKMETSNGAVDVKISGGVATMVGKDRDIHHLIREADNLLYLAKKNGRNRIEH